MPKNKFVTIDEIRTHRYDIIIGGTFMHLLDSIHHTSSMPYEYDDIVWCIQRSKVIPKYINILKILPPVLWFMMIFVGMFVVGTFVYFTMQFDTSFKRRNQMDWLHAIFIHTMSTFIGATHNFNTKNSIIRILYGIELFIPLFFHCVMGANLYCYMKTEMFYHQISTIREIFINSFRLAGSPGVLHMIKRYPMVNIIPS